MEEYNKQQLEAINLRNANILVSAGAGSGKTKVLTARVLSFLCDKQNPCSLDDLVIMTFTNAAANEMKIRIRKKIQEYNRNKNNDATIRKKLEIELCKLPNANISTIHKFCKKLIEMNYIQLGLDPNIKLAGENETSLILRESIKEAIDNKLNESSESFNNFSFSFPNIINDESIIINFIKFLNAIPFYKLWIEKQKDCINHYENNEIQKNYIDNIKESVNKYYNIVEENVEFLYDNMKEDAFYEKAYTFFNNIKMIFDLILEENINFSKIFEIINSGSLEIDLRAGKRNDTVKNIKSIISNLKSTFVENKFNTLFIYNYMHNNGYEKIKSDLLEFINLTTKTLEIYKTKKNDKHIMDTNDLEQYTLEILYGKEPILDENNNFVPNEKANELASQFKQVFIDEYQDSNRIQECILYALSSKIIGKEPNLFMVGDIKQSIYRFRQAEPSIFKNKYDNYHTNTNKLIELSYNYRSYKTVIDFVNNIFQFLFSKEDNSEIIYDDKCKMLYKGEDDNLKYSKEFIDYEKKMETKNLESEVILLNNGNKDEKITKEDEYLYIAHKIIELHDIGYDYKDIAILSRDLKNVAIPLVKILNKYNIPCFADMKSGFITLPEIVTTMDFLKVIDNPMQDILLISVLKSKIFNFTDDDLIQIEINKSNNCADFYSKLTNYYNINSNDNDKENSYDDLYNKCKYFFEFFDNFRDKARFYSVVELIKELYNTKNFYDIITFSKNAINKKANLNLLLTKASDYENTSFQGLFDFIRYIENIESKNMDEGIASVLSEDDDIVRIKTIHGSKGLEYKVVLLINIDTNNHKNNSSDFVYDNDYGLACSYVSLNEKIKINNTIEKIYIQEINLKKEYEELKRLLYVALTRAKEKLILIGRGKNAQKDNKNEHKLENDYNFTFKSMIENIVDVTNIDYAQFLNIKQELDNKLTIEKKELDKENDLINNYIKSSNIDFFDNYEYKLETSTEPKTSVSMIKKETSDFNYKTNSNKINTEIFSNNEYDNAIKNDFYDLEAVKYDNENINAKEIDNYNDAAIKGTSIHRFLEILNYNDLDIKKLNDKTYLNEFVKKEKNRAIAPINDIIKNGLMTKETLLYVDTDDIVRFLQNEKTIKMIEAAKNNLLFREKSFMKLFPYDTVHPNNKIDTKQKKPDIIVQGIIDLYYINDNKITLVDYKTDKSKDSNYYIEHYSTQLKLYKEVLESFYNLPVINTMIYSLSIGEYINI